MLIEEVEESLSVINKVLIWSCKWILANAFPRFLSQSLSTSSSCYYELINQKREDSYLVIEEWEEFGKLFGITRDHNVCLEAGW